MQNILKLKLNKKVNIFLVQYKKIKKINFKKIKIIIIHIIGSFYLKNYQIKIINMLKLKQ